MRYLTVLTLFVVLSACGRRDPVPPDTVRITLDATPRTLDPRFATSDYDVKLSRLVFSGLVTLDTLDGEPELDLAVEMRRPTPLVWEFDLHPEARFHDGVRVTAEDVVYTFAALGSESVGSPYAGGFSGVEVRAIDDDTVRFELAEANEPFVLSLDMGIVPAHLLEAGGQFPDMEWVGSGPYRFDGVSPDGSWMLRAHEAYHGEAPPFSTLQFRVLPDDNARVIALLGGAVDLSQNAVAPLMVPVFERYDHLEIEASPSFKYSYIVFNFDEPLLADLRVRQAVAMSIDRTSIIEHKYAGAADLSTGLLPPNHWAYEPDVRVFDYQPGQARELLASAGFQPDEEGCALRLELKTSSNKFYRSVAAAMASQMLESGICVEVRSYEWGTFFDDVKSGNFQMATLQWTSVIDPNMYEWVFHSRNIPTPQDRSAGGNRGGYVNPAIDRLIDRARQEPDRDLRRRYYADIQRMLAEDLPYVSLWHEHNIVIRDAELEGYQATPNARFRGLLNASWGAR